MIFSSFDWFVKRIVPSKPSPRYLKGIASYGKPVKSEKRKERIIAELAAMGVKPRIRRKMGRRDITPKQYMISIRDPKRMQAPRYIYSNRKLYKFLCLTLLVFLSSTRVEARHDVYSILLEPRHSRVDCFECGYHSRIVRYYVVPSPFDGGAPAVPYKGLIWPTLPAEILP